MIKEKDIKKTNKLDSNNLVQRNLSIQLSVDGFSFCIYTPHLLEVQEFGSYKFDLDEKISPYKHLELIETIFETEEALTGNFNTVNVIHSNNLVTQVPKPIFDKDQLAHYLKYSIKVLENDFITFDELQNLDIVNVYIPFVNVNNFLFDKYGAFNYKHSSTVLIENLLTQNKHISNTLTFVNIVNKTFDLVVLKNNQLLLYNCFSFKTKEDFIYYILFVAEQLNLNPEEFQLNLLGEIDKDSELFSIAYKYIRNVQLYDNNSSLLVIEELAKHSQFTLLNIN